MTIDQKDMLLNVVEREKATYRFGKLDRLVRRDWDPFPETIERWKSEGWDGDYSIFKYDESPYFSLGKKVDLDIILVDLVGIDVPVSPAFEVKIVHKDEKYTYVQTVAGAIEKFTNDKQRGGEIMPEYHKTPVEDESDWYNKIKPRLDPDTPERWEYFKYADKAAAQVKSGEKLYAGSAIGGYMYLRALLGPERVMYTLYDNPDMIHDMMKTWLHLIKTCLVRTQKEVPFFKILFGEDIAYKTDLLISPAMIEEFLTPYYDDLLSTLNQGQEDEIFYAIDSDGNMDKFIPIYKDMGFKVYDPIEIAACNDIVEIGKKHPDIILQGGIDKRILADSKESIKKYLEYVMPFFTKRCGYIPTCDHFVPSGVSFDNYMYYRDLITSMDSCRNDC